MAQQSRVEIELLRDIKEYGRKAQAFVSGNSLVSFLKDEKCQFAVFHCIEVMGEAASKLPKKFQTQHSNIQWRHIIGMRNVLIHDYFEINAEMVWETVHQDIPQLVEHLCIIEEELRETLEEDHGSRP